ncbi:penicillin-binding protein 2 [Schaalia sp. Marseille-Q2122]|uniref:peptidoglycan D,D-transpeptidase FtsI family protein n=1 Tax=Schaalia sp. Marseille-Q2122 TaxID=2736604 RepID=UPI00158AB01B|nr:penicillin-binding protein 2 [Schaalia sp. Marseille-Q2122]
MLSHSRPRWLHIGFSVALCLCAVNLFWIQVIQGPVLAAEGQQLRTSASEIPPRRGAIVDAKGMILADSVQTYHIAVNQKNILNYVHWEKITGPDGKEDWVVRGRGPAEAARQLAPLLGMDEAELGGKMVGTSPYSYLKKNVDAVTYRQIRALDIHGIEWESVFERIYPNGATAAPLLGKLGNRDENSVKPEGVSGLELTFEELLRGTPGKEAYEIAPNGAIMPGGKRVSEEPLDGATLTTTLHGDLQHLIQDSLNARVAKHQADWGAVVIQEVSTGRILVMADSNAKDPSTDDVQAVASVQYAVEPGSVGKVVTIATALDKGTVDPTTVFTVPYSIEPADAGGPISDFHVHETMPMTTTGILAESSNTGTVAVGETVSDQDRYEMMQRLGFGAATGVELPGESAGVVRPASEWVGRDRYVTMFGQSYSVTVLQEASLMATIGNGGVRMPPRIVDSWTMPDQTVHTPEPVKPVEVMKPETARKLITMMESAVHEPLGTGQPAKVEGYRVAVKTGTADIFVDGAPAVVSTTAGVVPAEAPRLAVAVVLYNPKVGLLSSESAAPLFSEVVTQAVRNLSIPASATPPTLYDSYPK